MANLLPFGQIRSFGMPAEFWVRRAERCREQNMPIRALALLRHAIQLEPDNADLRLEYACVLRELCCYEASNRACLELLARRPSAFQAYALVAENMLALGNRSEMSGAYEVYAGYVRLHPEALSEWDDDLYDVEDALNVPPRGHSYARLEGLLQAAGRRIQRGEWGKAKALLTRSRHKPFFRKLPQRDALYALYYHGTGDPIRARELALRTAKAAPRFSGLLLSMAMLLSETGAPSAGPMLMKAAMQAVSADDERCVCMAAAKLDVPWIAEGMLRRALKTAPNRMSALCDLAIFRLRAGDLPAAQRLARRLSELDPEDGDVETLCSLTAGLEGMDAEQVKAAGMTRPFYGAADPARLAASLEACCNLLVNGAEALADGLLREVKLRRQFLELFTLEGNQYHLLPRLAEHMPPADSAALYRRVLLLGAASPMTIQTACDGLKSLGQQPPFLVRTHGRFVLLDPDAIPPLTPSFIQRMLFRRLRELAATDGPETMTWALGIVRRMPVKDCLRMAADRHHVWALALRAVYLEQRYHFRLSPEDETMPPERLRAFRQARRAVRRETGRWDARGLRPRDP